MSHNQGSREMIQQHFLPQAWRLNRCEGKNFKKKPDIFLDHQRSYKPGDFHGARGLYHNLSQYKYEILFLGW